MNKMMLSDYVLTDVGANEFVGFVDKTIFNICKFADSHNLDRDDSLSGILAVLNRMSAYYSIEKTVIEDE